VKSYFDPSVLRLYAITADGAALDPNAKTRIRQWLQGGIRTIQLRDKILTHESLLPFGRFLRAITSEYGALFIVNDSPHLADLLDADGCHVGWEDCAPKEARKIIGEEKILGVSTHTREQVLEASKLDVDYLGVGPVYKSSTKDVGRRVVGPEFAGWAAGATDLPVVAIGGIDLGNVGQVVAAGCTNVAIISALNQAPCPAEMARAFLDILITPDSASLR